MPLTQLKIILEAALLAADGPLDLDRMLALFSETPDAPGREEIRGALTLLERDCEDRSIELAQVASGYRLQVKPALAPWVHRLRQERVPRYSRALLETLALVAYRQPISRGEIEEIRGVSVSTTIIRTLLERGWVRVVGHREVPGKPALYGTTREFLDYFGLKRLSDLPPLKEVRSLDEIAAGMEPEQTQIPLHSLVAGEESRANPDAVAEPGSEAVSQGAAVQVPS
ncbi:MAG TPA: SMC-Scp complex subunit ScpB [Gammaproteobacteria bacterium]|nr:SMC-Scp complex subunit ScpB [Gammaproteobacteria bacterium]